MKTLKLRNIAAALAAGALVAGCSQSKSSVEGVDLERGYTVQDKNRTGLYTQLSRMTRRLYMLLDSAKFDRRAFATMFPPEKSCRVISTRNMPEKFVEFYRKQGISCTLLPIE